MHYYYAHAAVLSFVHVFPGNSAVSDPTGVLVRNSVRTFLNCLRRTVDVSGWLDMVRIQRISVAFEYSVEAYGLSVP